MLIKKRVADILIETRDLLQDQQKTRYTDQELYRYLDQAVRNIALATRYNRVKQTIHVADPLINPLPTNPYQLDQEAIEFYKVDSQQPHDVIDARTIVFPENKDELVEVEYYAFPDRIVYGVTLELFLDEDIYDALKYFMAYRSYEKEASTENIGKAQYFKGQYSELLSTNLTRWHGDFEVQTSRQDFYL